MSFADILLHIQGYPDETNLEGVDNALRLAARLPATITALAMPVKIPIQRNWVADRLVGLTDLTLEAEERCAVSCRDRLKHFQSQAALYGATAEVLTIVEDISLQAVRLSHEASWYRKAADQGVAQAQFNLGVKYDNGEGVPQDYAAAVSWYRKAAEQGAAYAQFNLGVKYDNGEGVPQDYAAAAGWYRKAADQGVAQAQFNLGVMYAKGQGVPQDYVQAHKWFNLAAASGNADAVKNRDFVAAKMTPAQIAEAQRLASAWKPTK